MAARKPRNPDGWDAGAAAAIAGVEYHTLNRWTNAGLVQASYSEANGKGSRRSYSIEDLRDIRALQRLVEAGLTRRSLKKVVTTLAQEDLRPGTATVKLTPEGPVLETQDGKLINANTRQFALIWALASGGSVADEVDSAIAAFNTTPKPGAPQLVTDDTSAANRRAM